MGLPSLIIAILLSSVLGGIFVSYLSGVFFEGDAMATAATLSYQGQELKDASNVYQAMHSGRSPSTIEDLVNSFLLTTTPDTGIDDVEWEMATIGTVKPRFVLQTSPGVPEKVCLQALGTTNPLPEDIAPNADAALAGPIQGCYGDGINNEYVYYRR
ncbi:hypothetical protein VRRI112168_14905 [Vreelandella rituensis]|uniref:Uncharacterized protein n=1 Tax=Vreelandella rituensis TaxID=2282306 RepID=A0A368U997_9GAMM|nr:hypothetical protein [Halomonas rituensis]RCV93788.1 hypothetical protein DU506_01125 [Halomonas rituensis]